MSFYRILGTIIFLCLISIAKPENYIDSLLKSTQSEKNDTVKIQSLIALNDYYESIDLDSSLIFLKQAVQIIEKHTKGLYIGLFELKNKNPDKETRKYIYYQAYAYRLIGIIFHDTGKYLKALDYYQKSMRIFEELNIKEEISSSNYNIGLLHSDMNSPELAKEYLERSLRIDNETNNLTGVAYTTVMIGVLEKKAGHLDKAILHYNEALNLSIELKDSVLISTCYTNIALLYEQKKEYNKSLIYLNKALEIDKQFSDAGYISNDLYNIAVIYQNQKNYQQSISKCTEAFLYAEKENDLPIIQMIYKTLADNYDSLGNFKNAYENYIFYTQIKDSIYNIEKEKNLNELETKYQNRQKKLQIDNLNKEFALKKAELAQSEEQRSKQQVIIWFTILGLITTLGFIIILFRLFTAKRRANRLLAIQNEEILKQKEKIELQKEEITDSINYAKRIQQALLPDLSVLGNQLSVPHEENSNQTGSDPITGYRLPTTDYFVLFRPRDIVSGDFYWTTKTNEWVIACVADCTGHGVPGGFMSMLGISFLNEIVRKKEVIQANHILNELRKSIIEALKQTGASEASASGSMKDGMDISLIAIKTTPQAKTSEGLEPSEVLMAYSAQWAGANNPLWVIRPKSQEPNLKNQGNEDVPWNLEFETCILELKPDKMPIAIYERMDEFKNHELVLNSGDTIYLMSDGYEDQFGGPKHKKFLSKNLKQLLITFATGECKLTMKEQKEFLDKTLVNWIGDGEQIDDITILGIIV